MVRTAGTVRRVAVRGQYDLSLQRLGTPDGGVEVVDLEPQRNAVAVRARRRITDLAVVVADIEGMQLEHERAVANQPLVLLPAVRALAGKKLLVEETAPSDIGDRDERVGG